MTRDVIKTARLLLRPVEPGDEAAVVACLNDLAVTGWLAVVPHPYTAQDFRDFQGSYAEPGQTYAIADAEGLAGIVGVEDRTLGYWLAPRAQGLGYATEAARAALAEHFRADAADIASGYFLGNHRSAHVLAKLGFVETGRDMKFCRALGQDRVHVTMRLSLAGFRAALPGASEPGRLRLRPLTLADADAIARAMGNFEVTRWLTAPPWPYGRADAVEFLSAPAAAEAQGVEVAGRLVGVVGRHPVRETGGGLELGYWLAEEAWGQGLMTEAAGAAVDDHFAHSAEPLQSGYILGNARSAHVLEKLGFRNTQTLQRESRPLGRTVTVQRMVLTAEDHIARKGWAAVSPRLTYRPLWAADAPALHALVSQWDVARQLGPFWSWPPRFEVTAQRATPYRGDGFVWAMIHQGRLAGTVAVTAGELGYMLDPALHGQGLASEAVERALTEAFEGLGLDSVHASAWADNAVSLGLLRKFGFVQTGTDMGTSQTRPDPAPGVQLALSRASWQARAVVATPRLTMRAMTRADAPLFHDLVTRPEVARFLYLFHPAWTLEEARDFLDAWAWKGALKFRLALIHQGCWIGWIGATDDAEPEIFYALRPEFAGQGLGAEAVRAFSAFLFARFPVPALTAGVFTDNPASARVLEKCGFTRMREEVHPSRGRLAPAPLWVYRLERPQTSPQTTVAP